MLPIDRARRRWVATHILPHEAEVRGWLRRSMRSLTPHDIDDLVQETYARLLTIDYAAVSNGRSYVFAVIRHLLHRQAQRARIVPMERLGEIDALRLPREEISPERTVSARQQLERLERMITGLPEQARRAFQLQKFQGLSQKEIAQEMNISEKTVEKHLATALARVLEGVMREPGSGVEEESNSEGKRHERHPAD
jgi:RNA polymerase sigma factor (sigma-70 family)